MEVPRFKKVNRSHCEARWPTFCARLVSVSAFHLCNFRATPFGNFLITIFKDIGVCIQSGAFLHKLQLLGVGCRRVSHTQTGLQNEEPAESTCLYMFKAEGWK